MSDPQLPQRTVRLTTFLGKELAPAEKEEFYVRFDDAVRRLATALLRWDFPDLTEQGVRPTDVVNEVYIRIRERQPTFSGNTKSFLAYVRTAIVNHLKNMRRRCRAQKRAPEGGVQPLDSEPADTSDRDVEYEMHWLESILEKLVEKMGEEVAAVVHLRIVGYTYAQIEQETGINKRRAQGLLDRGIAWLSKQADDDPRLAK